MGLLVKRVLTVKVTKGEDRRPSRSPMELKCSFSWAAGVSPCCSGAPMGSTLTLKTMGMEPSSCFLESKLLTVLSGETTALTAKAAVSFPTRLIFPGQHVLCPGCRPIQSCVEFCSICLFSTWVSYLCHCDQSQTIQDSRSFREP